MVSDVNVADTSAEARELGRRAARRLSWAARPEELAGGGE